MHDIGFSWDIPTNFDAGISVAAAVLVAAAVAVPIRFFTTGRYSRGALGAQRAQEAPRVQLQYDSLLQGASPEAPWEA